MTANEFYYLRHGEAVGNINSLCQGQIDYPLTEKGTQQAKNASRAIKSFSITEIYSSDLIRAVQTAEEIHNNFSNLPFIKLKGLRERYWGELENKSNILMYNQEELELTENYDEDKDVGNFEKKSSFFKRVSCTIDCILEESNIPVIVGHGRFFKVLCEYLHLPLINQIDHSCPVHIYRNSNQWNIEKLATPSLV